MITINDVILNVTIGNKTGPNINSHKYWNLSRLLPLHLIVYNVSNTRCEVFGPPMAE